MSKLALITMLLVLGIVWGGFILALRLALQRERSKSNEPSSGAEQE